MIIDQIIIINSYMLGITKYNDDIDELLFS